MAECRPGRHFKARRLCTGVHLSLGELRPVSQVQDPAVILGRADSARPNSTQFRVYLDITIVDAATVNPEQRRRRANHDGAAAARAEDTKRLRYPGPALVPFAVEALGRPGESAVNYLRSLAPVDPRARSKWLGSAWQTLSVLVQTGNARLLLTAAHAA